MPDESAMFDAAILKKIEEAISTVEKVVPIFDKEGKKLWFKDKIAKGFTVQEVLRKLKEVNYDFTTAATYLDNEYNSKKKSQQAFEEVTKLKAEAEKKVEAEKIGGRLTWIITAFSISVTAAFSSYMIKSTVGESAPELTASALPGGDILGSFMKWGWIIAGAAGGIGLLLLAFFIIERNVKKTKTEEVQGSTLSLKNTEQEALNESRKREIEAELARKMQ